MADRKKDYLAVIATPIGRLGIQGQQALMSIDFVSNRISLLPPRTALARSDGFVLHKKNISSSPRIGVEYSGEATKYPYRFFIKGNPFVSGKPK
jgi:3-methyladenine DNA glycosylase Mpg